MRSDVRFLDLRDHRGSVPVFFSVATVVLAGVLLTLCHVDFWGPRASHGAEPEPDRDAEARESAAPDLSALNVRLSAQPIHPPDELVTRTITLQGFSGARPLFGAPTRAAILEDDSRRRVVILSSDGSEPGRDQIQAYLLYDFELERYVPDTAACASQRGCAHDRTPGTGGLGCIAMCLVDAMRQPINP